MGRPSQLHQPICNKHALCSYGTDCPFRDFLQCYKQQQADEFGGCSPAVTQRLVPLVFGQHCLAFVLVCQRIIAAPNYEMSVWEAAWHKK